MTLNLDDIVDFSFLSLAIMLSFFIDNINQIISSITYEFLSNTLSLAIQFTVLLGLIYKMRKFKKK